MIAEWKLGLSSVPPASPVFPHINKIAPWCWHSVSDDMYKCKILGGPNNSLSNLTNIINHVRERKLTNLSWKWSCVRTTLCFFLVVSFPIFLLFCDTLVFLGQSGITAIDSTVFIYIWNHHITFHTPNWYIHKDRHWHIHPKCLIYITPMMIFFLHYKHRFLWVHPSLVDKNSITLSQ